MSRCTPRRASSVFASPAMRSGPLSANACLLRPIPRDFGALRLLTGYAGLIGQSEAQVPCDAAGPIASHFRDLIALTLGATRDAAEIARGRGVRAARLRAIKSDIARNFSSSELSLGAVALRQGITPRYVSMLFAAEDTSFTDFVLRCRLDRAHMMLSDPGYSAYAISAIAFSCGFGDLSYFNRAFRRRYGATPSDVRGAANHDPSR
jgi:AraC-like DNA-binding protein